MVRSDVDIQLYDDDTLTYVHGCKKLPAAFNLKVGRWVLPLFLLYANFSGQ